MKLDQNTTAAQIYGRAMEIRDQEEANRYLLEIVTMLVTEFNRTPGDALLLARSNIGYFAGYYDNEARERVEKLFNCEHPIFGSIEKNGPPTPEQAFQLGVELGKKMRNEKDV